MERMLAEAGLGLQQDEAADAKLAELRGLYEPFIRALARRLLFAVPPVMPTEEAADNWQRSRWMRRTPGIGNLPRAKGDHFG